MNIAVIGLGIIGGSFCKAIKKYNDNFVIGINRTQATAEKALEAGAIDKIGTPESLGECDIIILALGPFSCVGTDIYTICLRNHVICVDINDDYGHSGRVLL